MNDFKKNVLLGAFIIAAVITIVSLILFLKPSVGNEKQTLYVRFSNIAGVGIGTRVTFAGRPVGAVKAIHEILNAREGPTDSLGRVYFYQLTLKIDSSVRVYNTDQFTIQTMGLMGEKNISIIPKAPPKGVIPKLVTDQVIYDDSIDPIEKALNKFTSVAEKVENLISDLDEWFVENKEELSHAITSFDGAMDEMEDAISSVNEQQLIPKITDAVCLAKNNLELLQSSLLEIQQTDTIGKFNTLVEGWTEFSDSMNTQGKQIIQNLSVITSDIADGTGSLGKIITSDDLYLRITGLLSKANTLMNDLNHYGLLFQYDKHWQRSRTKRANLLQALDSPKEFRDYFNEEMDSITTALSRLTCLLEKAQEPCEREKILESQSFKSDFNQLMNEVQDLYDTLKMYNENLIDTVDSCR